MTSSKPLYGPAAVLRVVVADASGLVEFFRALDVVQNAKIGFAAGFVIAALVYVYRICEVLGPVRDPRGSPALFLLLGFVLAVGIGFLVTVGLVVRSAIRLSRDLE